MASYMACIYNAGMQYCTYWKVRPFTIAVSASLVPSLADMRLDFRIPAIFSSVFSKKASLMVPKFSAQSALF